MKRQNSANPGDGQDETGEAMARPSNPRNGWMFAADTMKRATRDYDKESQSLLYWLFHWGLNEEVDFEETARRVGYNKNTLYKVFTGKYKAPDGSSLGPPSKMLKAIEDLRRLERKRSALGKTEFVKTPTVNQIWELCNLARESNTVAMLFGKSHVGKTWALVNYQKAHNHGLTHYIRIPSSGAKMELLKKIAAAIGIPVNLSYDKMKPRIFKAITPDMLLIFDEAHQFAITYKHFHKLACIELIRDIVDETGCGVVISGTRIWREELDIGRDKSLLEQLERRGIYQLELGDEPTKADLVLICKAFGLAYPTGGDADELRKINQHRGLRSVTEVLRKGTYIAKKRGEKLEWSHVISAWKTIQQMKLKPRFQ